MNLRLLLVSVLGSFSPVCVVDAAVDAGSVAARRAQDAGLVTMVPMASMSALRISAGSVVTRLVEPAFPREMRQTGMPGYVKLELLVDDEGRVCDVQVIESSAAEFSRSARRAAAQWQFAAVDDPQPHGRRIVRVPIQFDLVVAAR